MNVDAWLTLAVVGATVLTMARGLLPPGATLFGGMVGVLAVGVVTPEQALIGFSNPAPLTIAGLYVLARAVDRSGTLSPMVQRLLGDGSRTRRSLSGLLVPTAGASGVINNTPIVAMLVPQVERWAVRHGRSPSSYLMPLSFATILGGLLTLVGTTTTIVVSGLMETMGLEPLGFFEISRVGVAIAILGIAIIVVLAPVVIPIRRSARAQADTVGKTFVVDMMVEPGGRSMAKRFRARSCEGSPESFSPRFTAATPTSRRSDHPHASRETTFSVSWVASTTWPISNRHRD